MRLEYLQKQIKRLFNTKELNIYMSDDNSEDYFYCSLSGIYNGNYYSIYLKKIDNKKEIKLCHTTDEPKIIIDKIKTLGEHIPPIYS